MKNIVLGLLALLFVSAIVSMGILIDRDPAADVIQTTQRLLEAEELIETLNGQVLAMRNVIKNQNSNMDTLRWFAGRAVLMDSLSRSKAETFGWIEQPKKRE